MTYVVVDKVDLKSKWSGSVEGAAGTNDPHRLKFMGCSGEKKFSPEQKRGEMNE